MKKQMQEYWKIIIHTPWRMDEWIFWIVITIVGGLLGALIYLAIKYTLINF